MKNKAIEFEKLGKSRTFIIYGEESEDLKILAFFTLAMQVLKIPESFSNRKIKEFDGFNAKINGSRITEFPAILIGQIGKNDIYNDEISGYEIMQYCLSTLLDGQMRLSGRIILLECKNVPYLINFYNQFGFEKLDRDYEKDELLQLIKILKEEDIMEI